MRSYMRYEVNPLITPKIRSRFMATRLRSSEMRTSMRCSLAVIFLLFAFILLAPIVVPLSAINAEARKISLVIMASFSGLAALLIGHPQPVRVQLRKN